jgi:fluoroquinolone transport system permease protein
VNPFLTVLAADRKRIFRDPFLLFMLVLPLLFGIALRHGLPLLHEQFIDRFDLSTYYPLIICLFTMTPAMYIGAILSLQLIEEQEEGVLGAVAATPFSLQRYFAIRVVCYSVLAALLIGAVQLIVGIAVLPMPKVWLLAATMALQVPLLALAVATYANNQVEGMVGLKATSILLLPALAMFFVDDYWHLAAGLLPGYWPVMAYFAAFRPDISPYFFGSAIAVGLLYQAALIAWLLRRFKRKLPSAF